MAVVIKELTPPDTRLAYLALRELRPAFTDEAAFVRQVDEVQRPEGYRIVGAFGVPEEDALAAAGFRTGHNLAWGHFLYVDDLSTLPAARGKGLARELLDWLADEAGRLGCGQLHLDSGVGANRVAAHRLYFNAGYRISSYHFLRCCAAEA
jgi:GNAT superfamily N-acetyltransferase